MDLTIPASGDTNPDDMPLLGCRILVVEDERLVANDIARLLQEAGAAVVGPFSGVVDSLEGLCDLDAIDGALLDVGLGGDQSYPLADALLTTTIPFVFLTGVARDDLPARFARVPHLQKPAIGHAIIAKLVNAGVAQN